MLTSRREARVLRAESATPASECGGGSELAVSRVLYLDRVSAFEGVTIPLGPPLPTRSSNQPGSSGEPPSNASLFGLAPDGVCLADLVTEAAGALLPHPFNLTEDNVLPVLFPKYIPGEGTF